VRDQQSNDPGEAGNNPDKAAGQGISVPATQRRGYEQKPGNGEPEQTYDIDRVHMLATLTHVATLCHPCRRQSRTSPCYAAVGRNALGCTAGTRRLEGYPSKSIVRVCAYVSVSVVITDLGDVYSGVRNGVDDTVLTRDAA